MSTILAGALTARAAFILQDTSFVRWTSEEHLLWLNDGQREIVLYKPDAYIKTVPFALAAGSKQTLPADAVSLIDIPRNVNGNAVRVVSRQILDAHSPGWHALPPVSAIKHYMYNPLDPKVFYVYPPAAVTPNPVKVDLVYAGLPADVTEADPILIEDIYATALVNYILYRAYSKDAEYAANAALSQGYYQQFMSLIGVKTTAESVTAPAQALGGFNPSVPATQK
jgi:hypothetical protein